MIKTFFNILHGIEQKDVPLAVAVEMAIFLGYNGQLKQNSDMEMELFRSTIRQAGFQVDSNELNSVSHKNDYSKTDLSLRKRKCQKLKKLWFGCL